MEWISAIAGIAVASGLMIWRQRRVDKMKTVQVLLESVAVDIAKETGVLFGDASAAELRAFEAFYERFYHLAQIKSLKELYDICKVLDAPRSDRTTGS